MVLLNIFECEKNILNSLDATCERSFMATPRDKYFTKMYETLVNYNDRNDAPLFNENILKAMHKVIAEEESDALNITSDAHNITADNFYHTPVMPNTQGENENTILTSERLNNLGALS